MQSSNEMSRVTMRTKKDFVGLASTLVSFANRLPLSSQIVSSIENQGIVLHRRLLCDNHRLMQKHEKGSMILSKVNRNQCL